MMSLLCSCSIAEVKVSSRNYSRLNLKSSGHTRVDSQLPFKRRNRYYKNSRCLSVKWNEARVSRSDNELKKIERDEFENGRHGYEMPAKRITKSRLLWVKVHRTMKVYRLSFPTYDGKSRTLCRAGIQRGVGWYRKLRLGRDWALHLHLFLLLRIRLRGV
jgi:hypothetical protein